MPTPEARRRRDRLILAFTAGAVVAAIFTLLILTAGVVKLNVIGADAVEDNNQAARARKILLAQSRLLVECTTAPEERHPPVQPSKVDPDDCFLRQEARSNRVLTSVQPLLDAAASCGAAHPGDYPATRSCTLTALRAAGVTLTP